MLRRCASTRTDEIQIVRRPPGRRLGLYATRRRGSRARSYRTLLRRIEPVDGSCECADFVRNSLGLCKHLIAVLEHVVSKRRRGDVEREPALHALLQDQRARLARQIQTASTRKYLHHALRTLKQSLYRYQHDGVERFFVQGRLLLADDMGLGKTAQAIAACHALWHTGRVRRGLLVVPAALKPQWLVLRRGDRQFCQPSRGCTRPLRS